MLKNIMISFASIIGVFLVLILVWLLTLSDSPGSLANNQQVESTKILAEIEKEDLEKLDEVDANFDENKEFIRSNLKIISID